MGADNVNISWDGGAAAAGGALEIAEVEERDVAALSRILRDLWHGDAPAGAYRDLEAEHDLLCCLSRSRHRIVARLDGVAVGVCCAADAGCSEDGTWGARRDGVLARLEKIDEGAARTWRSYLAAAARVNGELVRDAGIDREGEVVLLAIGGAARGRGIGRRLLGEATRRLVAAGASGAFLFTDTDCDWRFYEHAGLERGALRKPAAEGIGGLPDEMMLYRVPFGRTR